MIDHTDDPGVDLELDGNAVGGAMASILGDDMTAVPRRCANCATVNMMGAMRAYTRGPGMVIRCPACDEVVLRIVRTDAGIYVDARGAAYLRFATRS